MALVNNDMVVSSDAIILLEGDGTNRIQTASQLFSKGLAKKIVFTGGAINYEYGSFPKEYVVPRLLELGVKGCDIIIDEKSMHTKAQAEETIRLAKERKWKRIILVASPDHQYRAFLTFLRTILDDYPDLIIINAPAKNLLWFQDEGWKTQFERLEQEFDRIEKYYSMGHLASYEEAIRYQQWKEQQLKKLN